MADLYWFTVEARGSNRADEPVEDSLVVKAADPDEAMDAALPLLLARSEIVDLDTCDVVASRPAGSSLAPLVVGQTYYVPKQAAMASHGYAKVSGWPMLGLYLLTFPDGTTVVLVDTQ